MRASGERGFTLLEVMVATLLMAIAVTGLLGALRTSLANASRLTETERAAVLARRQMDELLAMRVLPKGMPLSGPFAPELAGGMEAGWRAKVLPFESMAPPGQAPPPGSRVLERIVMEVWWKSGQQARSVTVEAFRGTRLLPDEAAFFQPAVPGAGMRSHE
ncbi:MAG: type II secretion system protein [Candidatus Solibacter usitatus]|nr:type II secretion system protein [Candidatus Solibacter usitatus]